MFIFIIATFFLLDVEDDINYNQSEGLTETIKLVSVGLGQDKALWWLVPCNLPSWETGKDNPFLASHLGMTKLGFLTILLFFFFFSPIDQQKPSVFTISIIWSYKELEENHCWKHTCLDVHPKQGQAATAMCNLYINRDVLLVSTAYFIKRFAD